jgi:tetratricopeptide (TPR) repeat protein
MTMSGESLAIGVEVRGLLQEIAADQNSALLRVGKPSVLRNFFDRQPAVSSFSSRLTLAERHILSVHRAELALRLRELCLLKLRTAETFGPWIDKAVCDDRNLRMAERRAWKARSEGTVALLASDENTDEGQRLLERCLRTDPDVGVSISQVALASLRVEARESARVYVGLDMLFRGQLESGLGMFHSILSGKPSPHVASSTWQNVSLAHSLAGNHGHALRALKRAVAIYGDRDELLLNWMHTAILHGEEREVIAAAARIDDLMCEEDPTLALFVGQLSAQRALGYWRPNKNTLRVSTSVEDSIGSASRRLLDVHS